MRNNFDYYQKIEKPNMYLCNPDRTPIGFVNSENRHLVLRFNDLSELSFTAYRLEGIEDIYDRLETKRLLFVDNIGWFQITNVSCSIEGNIESKEVTAESHQTQLKSRGFASEERVYMFYNPNDPTDSKYDSSDIKAVPSVVGQLHKQLGINISPNFADEEPTQDYDDWTLVYIDPALWFRAKSYDNPYESADGADNICRSFQEEKTFGYDFIVNNVANAFEVVFEFDFLHHAIKVKRLENITVATDIYLSLSNVIESINVEEDAENIVTVLSCEGKDLDIRTVNPMGTGYIVNFDYYKKLVSDDGKTPYPWMSAELITALNNWEAKWNSWQEHDDNRTDHEESYSELVTELQSLYQESEEIATSLQAANIRLMDLRNARDSVIRGDTSTYSGDGIIITETVKVGEKSLDPTSRYYGTAFGSGVIIGRKTMPSAPILSYAICDSGKVGSKLVIANYVSPVSGQVRLSDAINGGATTAKIGDYVYGDTYFTYDIAQPYLSGDINSMISGLIADEKDSDGNWRPIEENEPWIYFLDDVGVSTSASQKSYCKLTIAAEVGVVKDGNGYIAKDGVVGVKGLEFTVSTTESENNVIFSIICPDSTTETASTSSPYFNYGGLRYKILQTSDGTVVLYCFYVSGFQRYTTYKTLNGENGWCNLWGAKCDSIKSEADDKQEEIDAVEAKMKYISDDCEVQKYIARCGDNLYKEFSNYWIEGEFTSDNLSVTSETTMSETIDLAKDLMAEGKKELDKVSQPTFELSVSAINFIKLLDFRKFTDQLELGRVITVEKNDEVHFRPALVAIEYDLDSPDNFSLEFSTAGKLDETSMTFADLLNKSTSTSRTVSSNWSNITDYWKHKEEITNLLNSPLDLTLRSSRSNMSGQEFTIDETGILGRKKTDDSGTAFAPDQVRMMNNTIIFTDDNWQTIRTALGSIYYEENGQQRHAYGLIAEVLVGSLLLGEKLEIRNTANTISLDDGGITIKSNSEVDQYTNEPITVFHADPSGNVYVRGSIVATHLTLGSLVTIPESSITGLAAVAATGSYGDLTGKPDLSIYVQIDGGHIQSSDYQYSSGNYSTAGMKIDFAYKYIRTPNFSLDSSGNVYAKNADLSGKITSEEGEIGGFTIGSSSLKSGKTSFSDTTHNGVYIGSDGISIGKNGFSVTDEGNVSIKKGGIHIEDSYSRDLLTSLENHKLLFTGSTPGYESSSAKFCIRYWDSYCTDIGMWSRYTDEDDSHSSSINAALFVGTRADGNSRSGGAVPPFASNFILAYKKLVVTAVDYEADTRNYGNVYIEIDPEYDDGLNYDPIYGDPIGKGRLSGNWYVDGNFVSSSSAAVTSDRNLKHSIELLPDDYDALFDDLTPVRFKYNDGKSDRYHTGFIAQDVKASIESCGMTTKDFAAYVEAPTKDGSEHYLRYEEFIAINTYQIQKLKARVLALENEIKEFKGE